MSQVAGSLLCMESSSTAPGVEEDRAEALSADAIADRPLPAAGRDSLARAVDRLPEAIAASDSEAQARK